MRVSILSSVAAMAAGAIAGPFLPHPMMPISPPPVFVDPTTNGVANFTQYIDHTDHSKGTFQQRYFWSSEFYKGLGSPIVFLTPGEADASGYTSYLTNTSITGIFAQAIEGAVVMVEHRYWGTSSPYEELTSETLQYLNLRQNIADFIHFAQTVELPFDSNHSSNADNAPWVFSGGSYPAMLAAYTESNFPGTFWAYHASSAPVEAIYDFWAYYYSIQQGMAANCSKDVNLVVEYMDGVFESGTAEEQYALKEKFGLEYVEDPADVMRVLLIGPWSWQKLQFYSFERGYADFFQFCDAVENVKEGASVVPDTEGVGLEKALEGYAHWIKGDVAPTYCANFGYPGESNVECMIMPDESTYPNRSVNNDGQLQWRWMLCNEPLSFWFSGAPKNRSTIASRLVTAEYWQASCPYFFPSVNGYTYGSNATATVDKLNEWTKGWLLENTTRLTWTNGQYDPWISGSVSSEFRPNGPLKSTAQVPVHVIPNGFHCPDLKAKSGEVNAGAQAVIDIETAQIVQWVSEFYAR